MYAQEPPLLLIPPQIWAKGYPQVKWTLFYLTKSEEVLRSLSSPVWWRPKRSPATLGLGPSPIVSEHRFIGSRKQRDAIGGPNSSPLPPRRAHELGDRFQFCWMDGCVSWTEPNHVISHIFLLINKTRL